MSQGVFVTTPPADHHGGQIKHADVAQEMRSRPRTWRLVSTHPTRRAAHEASARIRLGKRPAYAPAGAFQGLVVTAESGVHQVWARYVGSARTTA